VIYRLLPGQDRDVGEKFSLSTRDGAAVLNLVSPLDYETKRLYEVVIEARDRAGAGEVNAALTTVIVKVNFFNLMVYNLKVNNFCAQKGWKGGGDESAISKAPPRKQKIAKELRSTLLRDHSIL
jgi:hypothetical protein